MNRRGFLFGAIGFVAAPAIVRAASLMPVSVRAPDPQAVVNKRWSLAIRESHFAGGWMLWDVDGASARRGGIEWSQSVGAFTTAAVREALGIVA